MGWAEKYNEYEALIASMAKDDRRKWCARSVINAWGLIRAEHDNRLPDEILERVEDWVLQAGNLVPWSPSQIEELRKLAATAYDEWRYPALKELLVAIVLLYEDGACDTAISAAEIANYAYNAILDLRVVSRIDRPMLGADVDEIERKDPVCTLMLESQFPPQRH